MMNDPSTGLQLRQTWLLSAAVLMLGCGRPTATPKTVAILTERTSGGNVVKEIDVGIITGDTVVDVLIGGETAGMIVSTSKSCGCAGSSLSAGDVLDFAKPFKASLSMRNKSPGADRQRLSFTFADGSAVHIELLYTFQPPPGFEPAYVLFRRDVTRMVVSLMNCPDCDRSDVAEVIVPPGINWTVVPPNDAQRDGFTLVLEVSRDESQLPAEGVIEVRLASRHHSTLIIPYLVLGL